MKNTILLYRDPGVTIDCFLIFFGLVFQIYINAFSKKPVFNIVTSISLKFISSNLAIVFITDNNF